MTGEVLVLMGGEGPVGRTTTALRLGATLQREGTSVALVDAHFEGTDLATTLDVQPDAYVQDVLDRQASVNDAVINGPEQLTVLPAAHRPYTIDESDRFQLSLRRVIDPLEAAHDLILVDTSPGVDTLHRELLAKATGTLLVTTTEPADIDTTDQARETAELLATDPVGAVVTQTESVDAAAPAVAELGVPALGVVPDSRILAGSTGYPEIKGSVEEAYEETATALETTLDGEPVDETTVALTVEGATAILADQPSEEPEEDDQADESNEGTGVTGIGAEISTAVEVNDEPPPAAVTAAESNIESPNEATTTQADTTETNQVGSNAGSEQETAPNPLDELQGEEEASDSDGGDVEATVPVDPSPKSLEEMFVDEPDEPDDPGIGIRIGRAILRACRGVNERLVGFAAPADDEETPNPLDELQNEE